MNQAIQSVRERHERHGNLGVFWHTQGAGKSYSMAMFTRKVHRKLHGNFTFLRVACAWIDVHVEFLHDGRRRRQRNGAGEAR